MQGVGTIVERKQTLEHFDTMQVEITCLFFCNFCILGYDILWPVMG
jgi:hypothetical protein